MSRLIDNLVNRASSRLSGSINPNTANSSSSIFTLKPSDWDPSITSVHLAAYPTESPPIYTVITNEYTQPSVLLSRGHGPPGSMTTIGHATISNSLSKADMALRGRGMHMRMNQLSSNFTLSCPPMGEFKWKASPLTGSPSQLVDGNGFVLAKLKSAGVKGMASGEKILEIVVPCDEFFVEMVLLSGLAARAVKKMNDKLAEHVVEAVTGVSGGGGGGGGGDGGGGGGDGGGGGGGG